MRLFELTLTGPEPLEVADPIVLDGRSQERIRVGVNASDAPRASLYRHPQTGALVLLPERAADSAGAIVLVRPSTWDDCKAHAVVVGTSVLSCPNAGGPVGFLSRWRRCVLCGQKPVRGVHPMVTPAAELDRVTIGSRRKTTWAPAGILVLPSGAAMCIETIDETGTASLMSWEVDNVGLHRAQARSLPAVSDLVPVDAMSL